MHFIGGYDTIRLPLKMAPKVAATLENLGRTEDLKFSPDNSKLVVTGFLKNRLMIIKVKRGKNNHISASDHLEIHSSALREPHAVSWIGEHVLIVGNREGDVCLFHLPARWPALRVVTLEPLGSIRKSDFPPLHAPGSLSVFQRGKNFYEVLICQNRGHTLSRHMLKTAPHLQFIKHQPFLAAGFKTPDSVAHDPKGRFIAVSNHHGRRVHVYDLTLELDEQSPPLSNLTGLSFPHGVRFSPDGKFILVADAAEPFVHAYFSADGRWRDDQRPYVSMRVVDDETFARGYVNPEEGGPKGIDIWGNSGIIAITCEETPLVFFDVSPVLSRKVKLPAPKQRIGEEKKWPHEEVQHVPRRPDGIWHRLRARLSL